MYLLPIAAGTAPAGAATIKTAKAAIAVPSAVPTTITTPAETSAAATATAQQISKQQPGQESTPATTIPSPATATAPAAQEENHDSSDDQKPENRAAVTSPLLYRPRPRRGRCERNTGIRRDIASYLPQAAIDRRPILAGLQLWTHRSPNIAHFGIVQYTFESVANFDPALPVIDREKHEDAVVSSFGAYFPFLFQPIGEVCRGITLQRMDCDHGDLRVRLVVHLGA